MVTFSRYVSRWSQCIFPVLAIILHLYLGTGLCRADTSVSEDESMNMMSQPSSSFRTDTAGFVMDMVPLLGENGRILAIAPDCRALTGILDGEPFVWSRDSGMTCLVPPERYYGMGRFLSDDGQVMAGFITINHDKYPLDGSVEWTRPGFLWKRSEGSHGMLEHGIVDVEWFGLSADGRVALGHGKEPIPGAPAADAPWEEQERFARTPEGKAPEVGEIWIIARSGSA